MFSKRTRKNLVFKTDKKSRIGSAGKFWLLLPAILIVVLAVSVAVILAREIIVSGFRMVAADSGLVIAADKIGKYKTATQDISIVILFLGAGIGEFTSHVAVAILNYIGLALFAISTLLTVISGINYIVKNIHVLKV